MVPLTSFLVLCYGGSVRVTVRPKVSHFYRGLCSSHTVSDHTMSRLCFFPPLLLKKKVMIIIPPGRKYSKASARSLHHRVQWLILTPGIRFKNIILVASEAGFNISVYLFTYFSNLFLSTILFSWTSHPTTIPLTSLQLPALAILHTAVSPTSPHFISP